MAYHFQNKDKTEEFKVSLEKYMDLALIDAFKAPRETALQSNFDLGLGIVVLAGYQAELLGRAKDLIKLENDPLKLEAEKYLEAVVLERARLKETLGDDKGDTFEAQISFFKIAFILKEFEEAKPNKKDMKV